MNVLKKIPVLLIFTFVIYSCEKKINTESASNGKKYLTVNGIITNENKRQKITLMKSVSALNEKPQPVFGAEVFVSDGDNVYSFSEDSAGVYLSDEKFSSVINKTFYLTVNSEGVTYTASDKAVPILNYSALNLVSRNDTLFYFSNKVAGFNPDEAAIYEVTADRHYNEVFPDDTGKVKTYFYILRTFDVSEIFASDPPKIFFPAGTPIFIKKYSLSPEFEKFIRSMLLETQWNGGSFDTETGNVYTNLSEGALGFFGVSTVLSDTVIAE